MNQSTFSQDITEKFSNSLAKQRELEGRPNAGAKARMQARISRGMRKMKSPMGISISSLVVAAAAGFVFWRLAGSDRREQISDSFQSTMKPLRKSLKPMQKSMRKTMKPLRKSMKRSMGPVTDFFRH